MIRNAHGIVHEPLYPGPNCTLYMPHSTAGNRFGRMLDYLGISGMHTHSPRHQRQRGTAHRRDDERPMDQVSAVRGHAQ